MLINKLKLKPAVLMLGLAGFFTGGSIHAEDIDLYVNPGGGGSGVPNVLFILDNTANWSVKIDGLPPCKYVEVDSNFNTVLNPDKTVKYSTDGPAAGDVGTKFSMEQCALHNTIASLPTTAKGEALFNVGFMLFSEETSIKGSYPRIAFTAMTPANKGAVLTKIKNLTSGTADKGAGALYSAAMHEAYLYYKGATPDKGSLPTKRDLAAFSTAGKYNSPSSTGCNRNYIIFLGNGSPDNSETSSCPAMLAGDGGSMSPATGTTGGDAANCLDEYARYLYSADFSNKDAIQNVVTHTIAVVDPKFISNNSTQGFISLMKAAAFQGGGQYFQVSDADKLSIGLMDVFNSIQSENSVFASASLPVSVTGQNQGSYLNQVFMGMFRPDAEGRPRWRGNLKQYKFAYDKASDVLQLVDADGKSAVDSTSGFITPSARSFWTTSSIGTGVLAKGFWINEIPDAPDDSPDGNVVEKGGVAEVIRKANLATQSDRNILTALGGNTLSSFTTGISDPSLGADRNTLIEWVRGKDNVDGDTADKGPDTTKTTVNIRPSVHGDALHSRPAVVAYADNDIVVYYGTNDGMLRAVNGCQTCSDGGKELWSFIPQEHFGKLNRLRTNSPEVRYPTTPPSNKTALPRDYFVDGNLVAVYDDKAKKRYLYVPMRRGGRFLYAFDITDKMAPKIMWKARHDVAPGAVTIPVLGQTWSTPAVGRVKKMEAATTEPNPVLVMGAGYDPVAEDADPATAPGMGNAVLILDAITGAVLKTLSTDFPVSAEVFLVPDSSGKVVRAYAVDVGGKVYRIIVDPDLSKTTITKIADLDPGRAQQRKFLFGPAVATSTDSKGERFFAVMAGSGDREKPLKNSSSDRFYLIKDYDSATSVIGESALKAIGQVTDSDVASPDFKGCYLALDTAGEKVTTSIASGFGEVYFSTNKPQDASNSNSCAGNLGVAKSYTVPLYCKAPTSREFLGGGLPPTPVAGYVTIDTKDGPVVVPVAIGATPTGSTGGVASGIAGSAREKLELKGGKKRLYWRLKRD
jgi:type IV pilus assembly protein PilY1